MVNNIPQTEEYSSGTGYVSFKTENIQKRDAAPQLMNLANICFVFFVISTGIVFSRPNTAKGVIVFCCFGLIAACLLPYLVYTGLKHHKGKRIYMAFGCSLLMAFVNAVMFVDQILNILNLQLIDISNYASPCEDVKHVNKLECERGVYRSSGIAVGTTFLMIFLSLILCRASYKYNRLGYSSQSNQKQHKKAAEDFSEEYKQTEEYKQNYANGADPVV
mmetsp:Transcript_7085/g.12815  ORF Transcript_7085/g.12815 Transcript_7085/m.12815 type:complete len:219 (-) Transcript_7085:164-820(-)|eukprot:CAMPEP_0205910128 /NCGR_PEP_ID=MMETSP1325-20131115/4263_1 /ASSEMBLY_ACC=CAM_ASM_000708 /TAXON_ID=236786 /ORGANISM="Florenciella sp., Strain RCC1007" /LENGTH=218 /DNA_ID=CAMNT_0053276459 /DNA_START=178 /DNA_END=834 /DNA_ORIENTATION=+